MSTLSWIKDFVMEHPYGAALAAYAVTAAAWVLGRGEDD